MIIIVISIDTQNILMIILIFFLYKLISNVVIITSINDIN